MRTQDVLVGVTQSDTPISPSLVQHVDVLLADRTRVRRDLRGVGIGSRIEQAGAKRWQRVDGGRTTH